MKLTNCKSRKEKALKNIKLESLSNNGVVALAKIIKDEWDEQELQDEEIVISALVQIAEELGRRVK